MVSICTYEGHIQLKVNSNKSERLKCMVFNCIKVLELLGMQNGLLIRQPNDKHLMPHQAGNTGAIDSGNNAVLSADFKNVIFKIIHC